MTVARPARFDVARLRLRNFKSIAKCDLALGPLALLVGPNGSGKSNVLDALRLTADALNTSLEHALRERGGVEQVRRKSSGHPNHFRIDLTVRGPDFGGTYGFEVGATKGDFRVTREDLHLQRTDLGTEDLFVSVRDGEVVRSSPGLGMLPKVVDDRLLLVALSGHELVRPLYDGLSEMQVFSLSPDVMKQPQTPDVGERLHRSGANVASVLERLARDDSAAKSRVVDYLRSIVPGIEDIERVPLGSWESFAARQLVQGQAHPWTFPAGSLSDGTVRSLGVLVALFAAVGASASTIGIEEPETALHPAAVATLMDALRDASERRQVLVTSHSPDLLDAANLRPDELVAVRAHHGTTTVGALDAGGRLAMREHLYGAGELLRTDQLQPEADAQLQLTW